MDLSREYLLSGEPRRRLAEHVQRISARIEDDRLRATRRRQRIHRLTFGLLGR